MTDVRFLSLAEILLIHNDQIEKYGGQHGLRDINLLTSAVAMPQVMFAGKYLHKTIFEMGAAYLFHLCQNHPFIDGNKRVGLAACLVFLDLHEITIYDSENKLYEIVIDVTLGNIRKEQISRILKEKSSPITA